LYARQYLNAAVCRVAQLQSFIYFKSLCFVTVWNNFRSNPIAQRSEKVISPFGGALSAAGLKRGLAGFVRIKQDVMFLNLDTSCGAVYSGDLAGKKGCFCSPPL
jgi:hypothetical protein